MKKAVVFGAGKIARGFVGQILSLSQYQMVFIDNNQALVDALNEAKSYHVHVLGAAAKDSDVTAYRVLHSSEEAQIYKALCEATVGFVSVGGNGLKSVGHLIGRLFAHYGVLQQTMTFITCENVKGAAAILEAAILEPLNDLQTEAFKKRLSVAEAVVMRTATIPSAEEGQKEPLSVWVQNFWELPVNQDRYRGPDLDIVTLKMTPNFGSYLTQKMYTNNTSSAMIAYHGSSLGYKNFSEAANSPEIAEILDAGYKEINQILIRSLGVSEASQLVFSTRARAKYTDPVITDTVQRHAQDPYRKLGPEERLIAPAKMAFEQGLYPKVIISTIVKALQYDDEQDPSSQRLQRLLKTKGIDEVLTSVCELKKEDPLFLAVKAAYGKAIEGQKHE